MLIFIVIILGLCRCVERQSPVERPLRADIETCHILVESVVKVSIIGHIDDTVMLRTPVCRMLVFRAVVQLPIAKLMLLVDIRVPAVYLLTVFGAKQIIRTLEQ